MFNRTACNVLSILCFLTLSISQDGAFGKTAPLGLAPPAKHTAAAPLAVNDYVRVLAPEKIHAKTASQIAEILTQRHFRKLAMDNRLSERLYDRYLSDLDGNRIFFLESDINRFEAFRHRLDDDLKTGNLTPAFMIFNTYQHRLVQRLVYLVDRLEKNFQKIDLNLPETLEIDRSNAPWPRDMGEMKDLWRKRLKNEVLKQKLAGKSEKEIVDMLGKRYRSQLNRTGQTNNEDAFRMYMNALASSYDPHTQYFSPRMSENFKIQMSLSLEGIGAVLQTENEHTKVVRLVPAGPADKGKELMAGDRIVGVGQGLQEEIVDVVGWRLDDVVELIRGPKNTIVRLEILPGGLDGDYQTRVINIERNTVKLEEQAARKELMDLEHQGRKYTFGIIEIPTFYLDFKAYHSGQDDYKSTTRDVRRLLQELIDAHVDGVIIDLRENGGGALQEASELTGLFFKEGPTVQVQNADGKISPMLDRDPLIAYKGPLVVLVNRMSASAAEIFAGAVQNYQRGIIVGAPTFGKGTVQSLLDLEHGQLKLTFAKFYRVTGDSTQHKGVIPDVRYPPVYNVEKMGESALPDALPWSKIRPVRFRPYPNLDNRITEMRARHGKRQAASPDFAYIMTNIADMKEVEDQTRLPLDEKTRRKQQDDRERHRLAVENKRRIAKGMEPVKTIEEIEAEKTDEENAQETGHPEKPDPLLIESGHVLADYILLSGK